MKKLRWLSLAIALILILLPVSASAQSYLFSLDELRADVFINDAQFSPAQLETTRKGWGHSSWLEGVKIAQEVGAKHLVLFHHDPESSDVAIDTLQREARQKFASVWAASEGMVMTLGEGKINVLMRPTRTGQRRGVFFRASVSGYSEDGQMSMKAAQNVYKVLRQFEPSVIKAGDSIRLDQTFDNSFAKKAAAKYK